MSHRIMLFSLICLAHTNPFFAMDLNKTPSENLLPCALTLHTTFTDAINRFEREHKQSIFTPPINHSLPQSNLTRATLLLNGFMNQNRELFQSPYTVHAFLRMARDDQSSRIGKALQNCLIYCKDQFCGVTSTTLKSLENYEETMLYHADFPPLLRKSITKMAYNDLDNRYHLKIEAHPESIRAYDVHESAHLAAIVSNNGTLQVWNFAQSKKILNYEENVEYGSVKFSSDGYLLATAMFDQEQKNCSIKIWDLYTDSNTPSNIPIYETLRSFQIKRIRSLNRIDLSTQIEFVSTKDKLIRCTFLPQNGLLTVITDEDCFAPIYCTDAGKAIDSVYVENNNTLTLEISSTPLLLCLWTIRNTQESKELDTIKKSRSYLELHHSCLRALVDNEINLTKIHQKHNPYSRTK